MQQRVKDIDTKDNPEKHATTGKRHRYETKHRKLKRSATRTPPKYLD
jgi:hypothetical protein